MDILRSLGDVVRRNVSEKWRTNSWFRCGSVTWTLTQTAEQMLKGKYCEEYMVQHKKGDAGVPDGTVNSTVYTMSQTSWRTLKSED